MIALIAAAVLAGSGPPPLSDLGRFPCYQDCCRQAALYRRHAACLDQLRRGRGGEGGRYAAWIRQSEHYAELWDCLCVGWSLRYAMPLGPFNGHAEVDDYSRLSLQRYRRLVGAQLYYAGWHPPLLQEGPRPMPRADGVNNAAGP